MMQSTDESRAGLMMNDLDRDKFTSTNLPIVETVPPDEEEASFLGGPPTVPPVAPNSRMSIPVGHWRDSIWDIFHYGFCHATVWMSCCCSLCATGQVIARLQLTPWGQPTSNIVLATGAAARIFFMVFAYWGTRLCLWIMIVYLDPNTDPNLIEFVEPPDIYYFFAALDDLVFYIYVLITAILLRNVRMHIRSKYAIPEGETCPGCEDFCCSCFCPCLSVGQILRHTADYDVWRATCCTETGLPPHAPSIV